VRVDESIHALGIGFELGSLVAGQKQDRRPRHTGEVAEPMGAFPRQRGPAHQLGPPRSGVATLQPVLVNDTASGRITALLDDPLLQVDYKTGDPKARRASFSVSSAFAHSWTANTRAASGSSASKIRTGSV